MYTLKELFMWKVRGDRPAKAYIKRGMVVGKNFHMEPRCHLDYDHCWLITIGDNVHLGPGVTIIAHDAFTKRDLGYARVARVNIGNNVYFGVNAMVLPGVTIGNNCMIGSYAVVTRDVPDNSIVAGNPGAVVGTFEGYINRHRKVLEEGFVFDESYTVRGGITEEKKAEMREKLSKGKGLVK